MRDAALTHQGIQTLLESGVGAVWLNDGRPIRADEANGKLVVYHKLLRWRLATITGEVVAGDSSDVAGARIEWRAADTGHSREAVRQYLASYAADNGVRDAIVAAGARQQRPSEWDGSVTAFFYIFDQLISDSGACARHRHRRVVLVLRSHLFMLLPTDVGLQMEVLSIPYTVYMNVECNEARIFLFGIGTKDTVVVETSGYSELTIGVLKKQHESSRKEKQARGWVLDSTSDPTGVVDLHVKSADVVEAVADAQARDRMNYDWKKMKLKCTVKLSRPIDPSIPQAPAQVRGGQPIVASV